MYKCNNSILSINEYIFNTLGYEVTLILFLLKRDLISLTYIEISKIQPILSPKRKLIVIIVSLFNIEYDTLLL